MDIDSLLDNVKFGIFSREGSMLMGSLMCSIDFVWDTTGKTAWTDGAKIGWNPDWFESITHNSRITVLAHELGHIYRLHPVRRGSRDPSIWNQACDYRINNDLFKDGYSFSDLPGALLDQSIDASGVLSEEEIYALILSEPDRFPNQPGAWGEPGDGNDLHETETPEQIQQMVNAVANAMTQAKLAGTDTSDVHNRLKDFLNPKLPWNNVLRRYFTQIGSSVLSWKRPNRRHTTLYLPSRIPQRDGLEHLVFFVDTSYSVVENGNILDQFFSEIVHVHRTYQPKKLTVIQFDCSIQEERTYVQGERINTLDVRGYGGTDLDPVMDRIKALRPTAVVILSDLECDIPPNPKVCPIIWVTKKTSYSSVPTYGKEIYIEV